MEVGYLHHLFSSIITGKDGNVVKSSDVKASGLRLPVISENGNRHSNSNQTKNGGSEYSDEKMEEIVLLFNPWELTPGNMIQK